MDRHEIEVLRQAKMYQRMGYIVKADINEWERPHLINNHRPDVIAILPYNQGARYEVVIVEVESISSFKGDHAISQIEAFTQEVKDNPDTTFNLVVINKKLQ